MLNGVILHELFEISLNLKNEELTRDNLIKILDTRVFPNHVEEMYIIS